MREQRLCVLCRTKESPKRTRIVQGKGMIVVAWIIVGLFAVAALVLCIGAICEEWRTFIFVAVIAAMGLMLALSLLYICNYYGSPEGKTPAAPTSDAISQSLTNGFLLCDPVWPTNAEGVGVYHNQEVSGAIHVIVPVNKIVIHK